MSTPHLRHNVAALGADYTLFVIGLAFVSPTAILPAFAAWLGAPNVVIGAIPAVMTIGWFLPCLFAAPYTEGLARKLPFILKWTIWERVPFLVLAGVAYWLAERSAGAALAALLAMLLLLTGLGGLLMPAWMDLIGRAIPYTMRGRFFAVSSVVAGVAGLGAGAVTAELLATYRPAVAYALCFLAATVCVTLSFVALWLVREPPAAAARAAEPLGVYLRRMPALVRGNANLAWYLLARGLSSVGAVGAAFYTVYALQMWRPPPATAGLFTALFLAGTIAGTLALGWLADHVGHRVALLAGVAASVAGNVVALAAPSLAAFGAAFVLSGVQSASVTISGLNVMLEFAPSPEAQPTYVGLGHTTLAPVAFAAPLVAGLLADTVGFAVVFSGAALIGALAGVLLSLRVRDPRHARALVAEGRA
ncbi:MAG TPA: MFS transporter [Methylomirabilota bacterium]|nr:MFS transporter [Methylomirabilota bacterium]